MIVPFDDDAMARWATLDLDDRATYDLLLEEMYLAGWDTALAAWTVEFLHLAIRTFTDHHDQSATAALVCQAMLVVWHEAHPDVSWMIHAKGNH